MSLIIEPGSEYLGYAVSKSGTIKHFKRAIISFFEMEDLNMSELITIGCDGTNINTVNKTGVIQLLETYLQKPHQWIICLLHMN